MCWTKLCFCCLVFRILALNNLSTTCSLFKRGLDFLHSELGFSARLVLNSLGASYLGRAGFLLWYRERRVSGSDMILIFCMAEPFWPCLLISVAFVPVWLPPLAPGVSAVRWQDLLRWIKMYRPWSHLWLFLSHYISVKSRNLLR